MLQTRYNLAKRKGEPGGGESIVETAGYIPGEVRIKNLLMAGQRLAEARAEQYDWPDGVLTDDPIPFGRRMDTDMAEATQRGLELTDRLTKAMKKKIAETKRGDGPEPVSEPAQAPVTEEPPDGSA